MVTEKKVVAIVLVFVVFKGDRSLLNTLQGSSRQQRRDCLPQGGREESKL